MVKRVIVSGGVEQPGGRDEAGAIALQLEAKGMPQAVMLEHTEGTDTMQTASHVAAEGGSVVAVTLWFRPPRAVLIMRRLGMREVSGTWPRFAEVRNT